MKKSLKKTIGAILAIAWIFVAICTVDGSQHEIALRFGGVAAFAVGAFLGEAFDFQNKDDNEQLERREDHDPYPEEFAAKEGGRA